MSSTISVDDLIKNAKKNKLSHVALIDINTMYGALEFYNKAKANNLIPIIGLQINYQNHRLVLIAKDYVGYQTLIKISSFVCSDIPFDINDFITSLFIIVESKHSIPALKTIKGVYSANSADDGVIAIQECFFENKHDVKLLKSLLAIKNNQLLSDFDDLHDFDDKYMLSEQESKEKFSKQALYNLDVLINACHWEMPCSFPINFVKFDTAQNSKQLLETKCMNGLKNRSLSTSVIYNIYLERLTKELNVINQMNYNDYFLVVQDYVNYAKQNKIVVGPGRGSAAGSLVSYVLGITDVDPIKHNLIFERFLNIERTNMPDIDVDFMDNRRNEVIEYIVNKYSKDRVAHIVTFQRMKAKMAIRDIGRILNIDISIINTISKLITLDYDLDIAGAIKNNEDLKYYARMYGELFEIANKFLNFPRQIGLHAAGIIVTNNQLENAIPIQSSSNGIKVTQYSMEYLEYLGLIKMDILGLINLTTINDAINLIRTNHHIEINLNQLNLEDQKVFKALSSGDTTGVFQLESAGMQDLIMKINPTCIEDISITSALFRPGPQKNIPTYLQNKLHPHAIKYLNDDFQNVLASTYNVIIYQEQVIAIVQRVTKFSLAQSDVFRRAISKKNVAKLMTLQKQFISASLNNGYSEIDAHKIYDFIYEFANYGFNHSHSIAYSYISY
jgi:DNA polymerase-3 subunit alpha